MKILICEFGQETNTFSTDRTDFKKLAPDGWIRGETIVEKFRGTGSYLGGAIRALEEEGAEIVALDSVVVTGGAPMTKECFSYATEHLLSQIRENYQGADGLFFAQHGGGAAEGIDSLEIYLLTEIRKTVGREFPITSSLDMHSCVTEELCALSDGLFPIKEFPHSDMAEASYLAAKTLVHIVRTGIRPVMTVVNLPIILPNTTTCTTYPAMKAVKEHFAAVCAEKGFLDCSLIQGYSANDAYWSGVAVLILSDRKEQETAEELAAWFWARKHDFDPHPNSAEQALALAKGFLDTQEKTVLVKEVPDTKEGAALAKEVPGTKTGPVVINESTDNPGSGCPGDGTHLLRKLVEENLPKSVFAFIVDPETAAACYEAGPGAVLDVKIGGKRTEVCGSPLELSGVTVEAVSDGRFTFTGAWRTGTETTIGTCVLLRYRNVDIVVGTATDQTFDDGPLRTLSRSVSDYRLIALKSAGHFRGYYDWVAAKIIPCETPGLRPSDLRKYPYQKLRRPIYPLDEGVKFLGKE